MPSVSTEETHLLGAKGTDQLFGGFFTRHVTFTFRSDTPANVGILTDFGDSFEFEVFGEDLRFCGKDELYVFIGVYLSAIAWTLYGKNLIRKNLLFHI